MTQLFHCARWLGWGICVIALSSCGGGSSGAPLSGGTNLVNAACEKFHPGMEFRVASSNARQLNGVAQLQYDFQNYDVHNFNGILYQIDWGNIETSPGVYNWSELDQVLNEVKAAGKYLRVRIEDRTFFTGCNSNFIPSYVARDPNPVDPNMCYARIWEQNTMDSYIAVVTAMVNRYASDPTFVGVADEETALDAVTLNTTPSLYATALYPQLTRLASAVHVAAPDILFTQDFNWPYLGNISYFTTMANQMVAQGGGGIGWPDSLVADEYTYNWYSLARQYYAKLLIAPEVQSGAGTATTVNAALADNEAVYQMLVGDMHANIIVWDTWNVGLGSNYFPQVVIPIVNNHAGMVTNTACPYH